MVGGGTTATGTTGSEVVSVDPRSVVISGVTTAAWYAVPDLVRPRWGRALLKTAVLGTGTALALGATSEGRNLRAGIEEVRALLRGEVPGDAARGEREGAATSSGTGTQDAAGRRGEGVRGADREAGEGEGSEREAEATGGAIPPALAAAGVAGAVALTGVLAVAGEKWLYRRGERLRARGVRLPHTRVGLVVGAVAAALATIDPNRWTADDAS